MLLDSSELLFMFLSFANTRLLLDTSRVLVVYLSSVISRLHCKIFDSCWDSPCDLYLENLTHAQCTGRLAGDDDVSCVSLFIEAGGDFLAAYSNAGIKSEDGNSVYRSRKRPATCLLAGCLQQSWNKQ